MHRLMKRLGALVAVLALAFMITACEDTQSDGTKAENKTRTANYDKLVKNQPAHTMDYSPSRDTKNFWIDTWDQKGKVSYVYLIDQNGDPFSYAVFKRLPVSYCTGLVPPVQKVSVDGQGENVDTFIPAPSIDGTYSSGNNCNTFYGEDATTGAYVEYTAGLGATVLLRDQPLPLNAVEGAFPLGDTTAEEAEDLQ